MPITKDFVTAGNATFTVECPDGDHYTYKVQMVPGNEQYPNDAYFVKTLIGPDNTSAYAYMGRLSPDTGAVTVTAKSKQFEEQYRFRLLNRILARVWADDHAAYEQHGFKTHHEGKCGRCGRTLTVPESIQSGIGPECARRMAGV
jgi:hypothetical protein